jgi:hypothetical protein
MNEQNSKPQQDVSTVDTDNQGQTAVPYTPPPAPDEPALKQFRSPFVNGILVAIVILLVGFMAYNFIGHAFTRVAGESQKVTITPSKAPQVSPSISPISTSPVPSK